MSTTPVDLSRRRSSNRPLAGSSSYTTQSTSRAKTPERAHDGFIPTASVPETMGAITLDELTYNPNREHEANPLRGFLTDEIYSLLRAHDLINEKGLRDFIIRNVFRTLRDDHQMKTTEAIERLQSIYPYLQIDTIRKIVYRIASVTNRKGML